MLINLNYYQLVDDLIPNQLLYSYSGNTPTVNEIQRDWNYLMSQNVINIYSQFVNYYNQSMFQVNHNGQLLSMEHYLNNYWNWYSLLSFPTSGQTIYTSGGTILTNGQIYIEDGGTNLNTYLYNEIETVSDVSLNTYLYNEIESGITGSTYKPTYLYNEGEIGSINSPDFIVYVPNDIFIVPAYYSLIDLAVNWYKPAGRTYQIVSY